MTTDPVASNQSKHVGEDGKLRYAADGSEVFPGATGVREPKTGIAPGTKLNNGATVLLSAGPGAGDYCVVLAQTPSGEYVTWRVAADTLDAFWGDYYNDDLPAACESFLARGFSYGTSRFGTAA